MRSSVSRRRRLKREVADGDGGGEIVAFVVMAEAWSSLWDYKREQMEEDEKGSGVMKLLKYP